MDIKEFLEKVPDHHKHLFTEFSGVGDVIEGVTKSIGIKPCGGCKKRKDFLNKKFPFKKIDDRRTDDDREDIRQP